MRKLLFICLLFSVITAAQEKGNISLVFDNETLNIPLNYVEIRKDNEIRIVARGEINNESERKFITMEIAQVKLDKKPKGFRLQVSSNNKKEDTGNELLFTYLGDDMTINISRYKNGEKITRNATFFNAHMDVTDLKIENDALVIKGNFDAVLKSTYDETSKQNKNPVVIAEIKNGSFEIKL